MFKVFLFAFLAFAVNGAQAKLKEPKIIYNSQIVTPTASDLLTLTFDEPFFWTDDGFLSFSHDNCFSLTRSKASPNTTVTVHFQFDPNDQFDRVLFQLDQKHEILNKTFCLDDYIYLNRMKTYQLRLTVEGPVVLEPFQLKLEQHEGEWTLVKQPIGERERERAEIIGDWLFFNDIFDYSFTGPDQEGDFYACDWIANCYHFNQEKLSSGNQIHYSLSPETLKKLHETTPFIRIYSNLLENAKNPQEENLKYSLNYNKASQQSLERIHAYYPQAKMENYSLSFTQKLTTKDSPKIQIKIPLDAFDLRIYEVVTRIQLMNGNSSYLELVSLSKTDSRFNFPEARITSDDNIHISTEDLFTLGGDDLARDSFKNKNLTMDFEIHLDQSVQELEVQVSLSLEQRPWLTSHRPGALFRSFPKDMEFFHSIDLWQKSSEIKWMDWQQIANQFSGHQWLYQDHLKLNITDEDLIKRGVRLNSKDFKINRLIMGNRGDFFQVTPLVINFSPDGLSASYVEPILNEELPLKSGEEYFKVGYHIMKDISEHGYYETGFEEWSVKFNIELNEHVFGDENCKRVPSFAQLLCHEELFTCPPFFLFNEEKGFCELIKDNTLCKQFC